MHKSALNSSIIIFPQIDPSSAIVLREGFINRIISIFIRRWMKAPNVTERIFINLDDAVTWLRQFHTIPIAR